MREVKSPEVRKNEILMASQKLFYTKGYIETTTQDIVKELNISRGLLYYHFKSKEDILYEIINMYVEDILITLKNITFDEHLSPSDKVRAFIESTIKTESNNPEEEQALSEAVNLPENTYLMDKVSHRLAEEMTILFGHILIEGNKKGDFDIKNPEDTAVFLMTAYNFVANDNKLIAGDPAKAFRLIDSFKGILNKVLNAREPLFENI